MSFRPLVTTLLLVLLGSAILWEAATRQRAGERQRKRIEEVLATELGDELRDLVVTVDGKTRTAFLSGTVNTKELRLEVSRITNDDVRGLLTVYNEIKVDELLELLLVRLKRLLDADPTEGEFSYRIAPDGHTVTIDGWVPLGEGDLHDEILLLVENIPGVRQVHDNLSIGRPDDDINQVQEMIFDILRLGNIYFDYNKDTIRPESRESVQKIAGVLQEYSSVGVRVEGHTDSIASEGYNLDLSNRRSLSVKNALIEYGVEESRIDSEGYGETRPVAPNDTPEGRAENRRIEFRILRMNEDRDATTTSGESAEGQE